MMAAQRTSVVKTALGTAVAMVNPQCRFDRCLFVIGHMRCGSTALSHILCSRPEISGYGEAHIAYRSRAALGVLVVNQWRRKAWKPGARHLFDKILHTRYDDVPSAGLSDAHALFVARDPETTIRSIRTLFARIGSDEYATDAAAADYYIERMRAMLSMWAQFAAPRRIAFTHAQLTGDPQRLLDRISHMLDLAPQLENRYSIATGPIGRGAGDPLVSHRHDRIVPQQQATSVAGTEPLAIGPERLAQAVDLFEKFVALTQDGHPAATE